MEHGQRPEIDWVLAHAASDDIALRKQIGTAMVVDNAFRVAGGAGCVIEGDRVPFVERSCTFKPGVAFGKKCLIVERADAFAGAAKFGIVIIDYEGFDGYERKRGFGGCREFAVDNEDFRFAVIERERQDCRIKPRIQRVEHGTRHRHSVMAFEHCGGVGKQHRDRVATFNAALNNRIGQTAGTGVEIAIGAAQGAVNDRRAVRIDGGGALKKTERRQRLIIRRILVEIEIVDRWWHGQPSALSTPVLTGRRAAFNRDDRATLGGGEPQ